MEELIVEHVFARQKVGDLAKAKSPQETVALLNTLADFYPGHIEKEDKRFFLPVMAYFSFGEQEQMLEEFREFDSKMIHEKYIKLVEACEKE